MVEYSKNPASPSEIESGYSEEGYVPADLQSKEPSESYQEMNKAGLTEESSKKLKDAIAKQQTAGNAKLTREKRLKILFLQYIHKYLEKPDKFIKHPKQIRNLPSWFDDAIILFKDNELSRYQKKMIREFFYGLIQYRDSRLVTDNYDINSAEANRQLGESSPYSESGGLGPSVQLPRERELNSEVDLGELMRRTREIDVNKPSEPSQFEEYGGVNPYTEPSPRYTSSKGKATFGALGLGSVNQSNGTVNDYVKFNKKEQVMPGETQSNPVQRPVQTNTSPVANVLKSNKGAGIRTGSGSVAGGGAFNVGRNMLGGMFGNMNRSQMIGSVGLPQPRVQPTPTVVTSQAVVERRRKKMKIKMDRKKTKVVKMKPLLMEKKSSDTVAKVLKNINTMGSNSIKPLKTPKASSGLATVRNMDKLFTQVKSISGKEFGKQNMKMKLVTNIKDQCDKAFANNKFKQESMKMKKDYFNDVKASFPQMRMDIEEMGDIKENRMMQSSMNGAPSVISARRTIGAARIRRGEMRPQSFGIAEYDFSIEPLGKRKSKRIELLDEDDFIERG